MLDKQSLLEQASNQINQAIAALLASDPANHQQVAKLSGSQILIQCTEPSFDCLLLFGDESIELTALGEDNDNREPDLELSGTALRLMRLATAPIDQASALRESSISVKGDIGLLLQLSQIAKMIEIDWEWLLAEKIGEAPAVVLSRLIQSGFQHAQRAKADLSQALTEKFQSEHSPLPTQGELETLKRQLRDLNYRLDRLEATRQKNQAREIAP